MNKLEAITWLYYNDPSFDEWSEAGMWQAVRKIIKENREDYGVYELTEMLNEAKDN